MKPDIKLLAGTIRTAIKGSPPEYVKVNLSTHWTSSQCNRAIEGAFKQKGLSQGAYGSVKEYQDPLRGSHEIVLVFNKN